MKKKKLTACFSCSSICGVNLSAGYGTLTALYYKKKEVKDYKIIINIISF